MDSKNIHFYAMHVRVHRFDIVVAFMNDERTQNANELSNNVCILTIHRDNWPVALIDSHHVRIVPFHRRPLRGMADGLMYTIPTSIHQMPMCPMLLRTFYVVDIPMKAIWLDDSRCRPGNCNHWETNLVPTNYRPILRVADHQYCIICVCVLLLFFCWFG